MNAGIRLAMVALTIVFIVSVVAWLTSAPIERANEQWIQQSLNEIVPPSLHDEKMITHAFDFQHSALGSVTALRVYPIVKDAKWNGSVVTAIAPDGYTGDIALLIAIHANHSLLGVRVISHKETPGLGDDIEIVKSSWIKDFDNASLTALTKEQWAVRKDGGNFDQFTGATITPRAVVNAVYRVLHWHEAQGLALLQQQFQATIENKALGR